jgi:ABC-2 type transport system permease protein
VKATYFVVIGGLVVVAVLRRRRGLSKLKGFRKVGTAVLGGRHPLGDTGLVAAREIRERLRGRYFKIVTIILLLVVSAAVVIPTIHTSTSSTSRVGLVGSFDAAQRQAMTAAGHRVGLDTKLVQEPDLAHARSALRDGRVTLLVDGATSVVSKTPLSASSSTTVATLSTAIASALGVDKAFRSAHLSAGQIAVLSHAGPVPIRSLERAAPNGAARGTSVIGLIMIFIMLTQYLTWTLMGVLEEKVSRVVEVLLAAVRPIQLLGGKLLGIGAVALLQAGLVVALALILADAVGSDLLKGTAPLVVVASLVWLVVGYAFYSWVYAAAGSMTSRQDQVQSLALPLSIPIVFGYIVALTNAGPTAPSLLVKVLAYLPPTAPFAMPLLVGKGATSWWEFLVSVAISAVCTVGVAHLAANVYRRAVLRTGRRTGLRELLASSG